VSPTKLGCRASLPQLRASVGARVLYIDLNRHFSSRSSYVTFGDALSRAPPKVMYDGRFFFIFFLASNPFVFYSFNVNCNFFLLSSRVGLLLLSRACYKAELL
jgi:hypothetical protein